jgi:2-keto-3-deoxy-L-rhamnonate aldolase RhmA
MANLFKSLIQSGKPAIGSWIAFADPYSVELMADAGFDWLLIDTEHVPIDRQALRTILVSMKGSASAAIVRLSSNSQDHFQTALDLGAQGVVVPMINTREDAARAVGFCRYPPLGIRGFSPTRASRYFQDLRAYAEKANDEIALIIQIETPQAVESMDEILKTESIDGIFIGPSDLASFMSRPAQTDHPDVQRIVDKAIDRARDHSIPFGLPTWSAEECLRYVNRGGQILTVGSDLQYLGRAARAGLTEVRSLLRDR